MSEYELTDAEKEFIEQARKEETTSALNQVVVISNLILSKRIKESTDKMIASNKRLAESNDRHSIRMFWLTGALVFAAVVQLIMQIIQI